MKTRKLIALSLVLFALSCSLKSQNIHPNNRISLALGGPTAYVGLQYEHFFPIDDITSLSTGVGVGGVYDYFNISLPLMINWSVSAEKRVGIGFSYTHFPAINSYYDEEYLPVFDVLFFNLEYNYLPLDSRWEWTAGINPLYEIDNNLLGFWGGVKVSYVFNTKFEMPSSFRFKKRYNLRTK